LTKIDFTDIRGTLSALELAVVDNTSHYAIKCVSGKHPDNKPSLRVNKETGQVHCFVCGYKGNLFTLAKTLGVGISSDSTFYSQGDSQSDLNNQYKKEVQQRPKVVRTLSHKNNEIYFEGEMYSVFQNQKVLSFLRDTDNGVSILDDSFIEERGIKYCTYAKVIAKHLLGRDPEKFKPTTFYKRLLFPIYHPESGKMVNIEGRTYVGGKPKVLYPKGGIVDLLYNYEFCDLSKPVVKVEGIKDFCKVWNIYPNVVATFNPLLGEYQLKQLLTFQSDIIDFIDNDKAGWLGVEDLDSKLLDRELKICYNPEEGKDPFDTDFEMIADLLEGATTYTEELLHPLKEMWGVDKKYEW